ncbi:MAG: histidine phosphatase family protein [bacterium]|nr:histidine phosphatase family protein [bacterium]
MKQHRIILIRHGQTKWNSDGRLNSTTDLGLSQQGRRDLATIRRAFSGVQIDRVISSPLLRARETAHLVAPELPVEIDPRLVEVDFGPFEGKTPRDFSEGSLAEAFRLWRQEPEPLIPDGAEDFHEAARRGQDFLDSLLPVEETILVVSHGVFLRVLLCGSVLNINPCLYRRLRIDNGRISVIQWEGELPRLAQLNAEKI